MLALRFRQKHLAKSVWKSALHCIRQRPPRCTRPVKTCMHLAKRNPLYSYSASHKTCLDMCTRWKLLSTMRQAPFTFQLLLGLLEDAAVCHPPEADLMPASRTGPSDLPEAAAPAMLHKPLFSCFESNLLHLHRSKVVRCHTPEVNLRPANIREPTDLPEAAAPAKGHESLSSQCTRA